MGRVAILVDGNQIAHISGKRKPQGPVNPIKLLEKLCKGDVLVEAFWYQSIEPDESGKFAFLLDFVFGSYRVFLVRSEEIAELYGRQVGDAFSLAYRYADAKIERIVLVNNNAALSDAVRELRARQVLVELACFPAYGHEPAQRLLAAGGRRWELDAEDVFA